MPQIYLRHMSQLYQAKLIIFQAYDRHWHFSNIITGVSKHFSENSQVSIRLISGTSHAYFLYNVFMNFPFFNVYSLFVFLKKLFAKYFIMICQNR